MRSFLKALVLVPIALLIVLFSVANRAPVRISLDPISREAPVLTYDLPLFAVILAAIAVGVLIGGLASWLAQGKHRKAARRNRREAEALRSQTQALRAAVPDSALPALTDGSPLMQLFGPEDIDGALNFAGLIDTLDEAFRGDAVLPPRSQYSIERPGEEPAVLLTMPAWSGPGATTPYIGTKILSVFFGNGKRNLPGVMGAYLLMDGVTGKPLAVMDGNRLTLWRTAAASALASRYMANPKAETMLMVGAGALAPFLIRAHRAVLPLSDIAIWARRPEAAEAIVAQLAAEDLPVRLATDLEGEARTADVISCATNATEPLIHGRWLKRDCHLDLVGGFTMQMREADAEALDRSRVVVDSKKAIDEGGDVAVAIAEGTYNVDRIAGTLADLCHGRIIGRAPEGEITVFKSVGISLEDLAAAIAVWETGRAA